MKNKINVCAFLRVSTQQQDYTRQMFELNKYCKEKGYVITKTIATRITGTKQRDERPDIQELFKGADSGQFDKVVVTEVSRIGRNARDIRSTVSYLHDRGISIVFKNLGLESLDADSKESFVTNIIISIYAELAQEERRILSERIRSGMDNARNKNKRIGRPMGAESRDALLKKYPQLVKSLGAGMSLRKSCKLFEVSEGTAIKVRRAIRLGSVNNQP